MFWVLRCLSVPPVSFIGCNFLPCISSPSCTSHHSKSHSHMRAFLDPALALPPSFLSFSGAGKNFFLPPFPVYRSLKRGAGPLLVTTSTSSLPSPHQQQQRPRSEPPSQPSFPEGSSRGRPEELQQQQHLQQKKQEEG